MGLLNEIISSNKKQYKSSLRDYVMSQATIKPKITRFASDVPIDEQRLALIGEDVIARDVPPKRETILSGLIRDAKQSVQNLIPKQMPSLLPAKFREDVPVEELNLKARPVGKGFLEFDPFNQFGFDVRDKLFPSEEKFFREKPYVSGMFNEETNDIIINPFSSLSQKEKQAVARLEGFRGLMFKKDIVPDFELTQKQLDFLASTKEPAYMDGSKLAKQTIASRIVVGDPSAQDVTDEQKAWVSKVLREWDKSPFADNPEKSGLTGFIYPPIEKRKRQFTKEGAEFITGTLEKALLPFTAPITVGANILQGLIREIKGKGSKGNIDAIVRIMAANPQPGDQIFVADLLKELGITDESASLPEGTIDRIGFIADWPLFGGVAELQTMLVNTLTSKFPAKTFNDEIKIILENSIGKTANTPEEESIKTQFVEPVLKSIKGTKKIKSVAPTIEPKLPVEPVKNVIPEEGKGTGEAFRPTLKEEVIVPRETIKPEGTGKAIYHFTKKENIENILKEGFDTNLPPIHGIGGRQKTEVYTAENKLGKGVLYFTTDTERWNKAQVYTGEGKGTKDYSYYDYDNQKWVTEKKALTTIDLSPLKATIKQEANILVIDSMKKYLAFQEEHLGDAFPKDRMAEVMNLAKDLGYDILNVKYKPKEWIFNKQDFYKEVTGTGGKDDYFVFNKDIIDYSLAKGKKQTTVPRETDKLMAGSSVKVGKSPQVHTIINEEPFNPKTDIAGERFFNIKNNKTGEIQLVSLEDLKLVKSKKPTQKDITLETFGFQSIYETLESLVKKGMAGKGMGSLVKLADRVYTGGGIKSFIHDMKLALGNLWKHYKGMIGNLWKRVNARTRARIKQVSDYETFTKKTLSDEELKKIGMSDADIAVYRKTPKLEDLKLVKSKKPTLTLNQLVKDPDKINDILANPALYDAKTVANAKRLKSEGGFFRFPSKKKKQVLSEIEQYNKAVDGIKGKWWQFRKTFQDEFIFAKKLQDFVSKENKIPEDINIDHARRLFDGRVHTRIQGLFDDVFKIEGRLTESSKRHGVSRDNLYEFIKKYMHAKHAPERNRVLRKPKAAGISDADADIIIKQIEAYPFANDIKKLADEYWKINRRTLKILHEAELIEDATYNLLSSVYKYHSPLRRITKDTDDITHILSGKGFDVRTSGLKRAKGSEKPIADIIENIVVNAQEAIIRAEKNIADLHFLRFARTHKKTGLFKEIKPKVIGTTSKGFIKQQINDPQVLTIMEKGKPTYLFIKDKRLALALKGVEVEHIPAFLKPVAFLTRLYAGLHTRFNYDFAMPNNIRDIPEMLVDISSRKGMGGREALKAAKKAIISSKKDIWDALMGKDTPGARLYKQMKLDGGTTGGLGLSTREQVVVSLEKIRKLHQSKPRMATFKLLKLIDNWNIIFEDSTRLSVYKTALDKGLSRKHAAFLAKEASINFNKHGTAGPIINSLYMFSNASIQNSTRILRAMKNPKVAAATISSIGAAVFAVDRWNKFIDPDYKKKLNKWERTNLTILLPTEDFWAISIPMSLGLKPIKIVWEYASDAADGEGDIQDTLKGMATAVFEAYNPLAGDEDIVSTLIPSIGKAPVEIARNRAWYGNKLRPDWDVYLPDSASYFPSLAEKPEGATAIKATEFLSDKNIMEISPANIVYAFNQYIGGAGRSIKNIISAVSSASKGELPNIENIPILNRFIKGKSEDEIIQQMFYANKDKISKEKKETAVKDLRRVSPVYETIQTLIKEGKQDEARVLLNGMTDYDYGIYKKLTERDKRQETRKNQITVFPKYEHIQELLKQGNEREARIILNELSDDEYKTYKTLVKQFSNN